MSFSFMDDERWDGLDADSQNNMIQASFNESVASDPRWKTLHVDQQNSMLKSYQDEALAYKPPQRTVFGTIKDIGIAGLKGAIGIPEAAVGLADIPTGGRVGKFLEEKVGFRPGEAKEILTQYLSPAQKEAQKQVEEAEGFFGTIKEAVKHPSTIAQAAIESAPLMGAGGVVARGVGAIAKISPWIAAAIGEGAVGAGLSAEEIRKQTKTGLLTKKQAAFAAASGLGTGAFNLIGGGLAKKFGFVDVDTLLASGIKSATEKASKNIAGKAATVGKRIIQGGISEGVFEELPQSVQEQIWSNAALGRPLGTGVHSAGAMGLLTGSAMGGGVNIFSGARALTSDLPIATEADIEDLEQVEELPIATEKDLAFLDLLNTELESKETTPEQAEEIKQYPQFSHLSDQIDKVVFDYNARKTPSDLSDVHKEVAKEAITEVIGKIDIEAEELGAYLRDYEKGIIPTTEEAQWEKDILAQRERVRTPQEIAQEKIKKTLSDAELAEREAKQDLAGKSDLLQKIDMMQDEVNSTKTKGVTQEIPTQQKDGAVVYSADSPGWMQELQSERKRDGKKLLSRVQINAVFNNLRNNKPLTETQNDHYGYIERAMDKYTGEAGEFAAIDEAKDLEKRGFDLLGGQNIPVAQLNKGDKFVGTVDGVKDEFEVMGTNDKGEVVLQDGVQKQIDMFDDVTIEGIKRVEEKPAKKEATVKMMITQADKINLKALGYKDVDIRKMKPAEAQQIIDQKHKKLPTQKVEEKPIEKETPSKPEPKAVPMEAEPPSKKAVTAKQTKEEKIAAIDKFFQDEQGIKDHIQALKDNKAKLIEDPEGFGGDTGVTVEEYDDAIAEYEGKIGKFKKKEPRLSTTEDFDLTALHNTTEAELMAAIESGGLAVPSVAITKKDIQFEKYGEITLVGNKELIDPVYSENKIFESDIYSARVPRREYDRIERESFKLYQEIEPSFRDTETYISDWDYKTRDNLLSEFDRSHGWKVAYLRERGVPIRIPKVKEKINNILLETEAFKSFVKNNPDIHGLVSKSDNKEVSEAILKSIEEVANKKGEPELFIRLYKENWLNDKGFVFYGREGDISGAIRKTRNPKTIIDKQKLSDQLDKKFTKTRMVDYRLWASKKIDAIFSDPYLKKGRKKLPFTLGNIVDQILSQKVVGVEKTMVFGVGEAKALSAKQMKTISAMHKKKGKLVPFEMLKKYINDVQTPSREKYQSEIGGYYKYDDTWESLNDSMKVIADYLQGKPTMARMKSSMARYDFENVPEWTIETAMEFADILKDTPTQYFEGKLRRAVQLNEFTGAVIPKTSSKKLKQALKNSGLQYRLYDSKDEAARQKAVNFFQKKKGVLFQTDQTPGEGITLKDIQSRFKNQDVFLSPDGSISIRMKNGQGLRIVSTRQMPEGDVQFAIQSGRMRDTGVILGRYQDSEITLNKDLATTWTRDHELEHYLEDVGILTASDKEFLTLKTMELQSKDKLRFKKSKLKDKALAMEEDRANAFAQFLEDREKYRESRLGRIIQKVQDFFDGLWHVGRNSIRKLARGVESGKIFEREISGLKTRKPAYEKAAERWYSKMQEVLEKKLSSAPASTLITNLNIWARKGEFKKEELEWSGVIPWLESKKGKITKQEVLDYLEENRVVVEDVVKGDKSKKDIQRLNEIGKLKAKLRIKHGGIPWPGSKDEKEFYALSDEAAVIDKKIGKPKFSKYQLPGGKNYKEVLLTLPGVEGQRRWLGVKQISKNEFIVEEDSLDPDVSDNEIGPLHETEEAALAYIEELKKQKAPVYRSPHYEEPNILVHIRMSERTVDGKKVLHIEEIQSDWHQEGRRAGYKSAKDLSEEKSKITKKIQPYFDKTIAHDPEYKAIDLKVEDILGDPLVLSDMNVPQEIVDESVAFAEKERDQSKGVPQAPFKKNWSMLAMKRMVRYAAENGFDTIAWTQGQEQADRYDLSKQIDSIGAARLDGGVYSVQIQKDGNLVADKTLEEEELEGFIGKELTRKIVKNKEVQNGIVTTFSGLDLKVGGEGMKAFYDRMLPNEVNKFFNKKAWGKARVGEIEIEGVVESGEKLVTEKQPDGEWFVTDSTEEVHASFNTEAEALEFITDAQEYETTKLHALPITPKMKSKALREGMPLFVTTEDFIKKAETLIYKKTLERTNTVNQTAEQEGFKYQGSSEKGQATIENIISTLRKTTKVDIAKEQKIIGEYRNLEKLAKDPQASVASKQKMLSQFLKILPVNVRSKVITPLTFISRFKQIKTHEKRIDDALSRAEKELVLYMRRGIIAGIKKGVTPKKLAKNRIKKDTIGHEAARDLQFIREVLKEKSIKFRMDRVENQIEKKEAELEEADKSKAEIIEEQISNLKSHKNIIETFGNIKLQKLEDLLFAKEALNSIILNGRALWRLQQDAFKEAIDPMIANVQQDISGQEDPKLETSAESTKRVAEKESAWGKAKGTWDAVENSILSWEFLMNKLSKLSGSKILQSYTTTEMGSVVQSATKQENIFNIETDDIVHSSAKRIFNAKTDKALNKKFMAQEIKQTGKVFSYNKYGKEIDGFVMSQMEAAYMYAIRKNQDSLPTFDKMGMTEKTFKEIENFIGPELKAWVDYNVDEYLQDYHFSVNQVYRQVYGTNLTKTPGYISWYRDVPGKIQDKGIAANPHETGAKGMSKGAFKERVKNTNPYRFMSFNDVLTRHVSEMNNFKAWAMPTKIINSVFNNRKTQRLIIQHHSSNMRSAIKSFQTDFTKSPLEMRGEMAWLDKMRGNITTAMTALNPTIFLKQLTSIPAMAESIPAKEWIKYEVGFWSNPLKAWNLLKDSKHWKSRRTKGMERDIRTAQAVSGSQAVANVRNLKNRAMFLVKWGDGAAILVGGYPVYKYHFDKNLPKMGREKAHQFALTKFEESMDRTQQASGIKDQGKFQRSGSYAKLFSMFLTAPKQYTSQITAAIRKIHSDPTNGDAYKRLFIFGIMMPSLFQATASGLLGLIGGDDEDEKKFISNQIKAILQSPLNGIPIIRDLQKGVWQSAMGEWYGTDVEYSPVTEAGESLLSAVFHGAKLVASGEITPEKKAKHWGKTINNLFETVGYAYGLPVETVRKMFMENWSDVVTGETDYPFRRGIGFSRYAMGEKASRYKRNIKHIKNLAKEIKENPEKAKEIKKDKTYRMLSQAKRAESKIKVLRKRMNRAKTKEAKAKLKKKIENIKKFFNKKFIMKKKEK